MVFGKFLYSCKCLNGIKSPKNISTHQWLFYYKHILQYGDTLSKTMKTVDWIT